MNFNELSKARYSVRSFKKTEVPEEVINTIIEAGLVAPTACNNQPCKITVVKTKESLEKLKKCTECHYNAPLAFIVSYDNNRCWHSPFENKCSGDIDASIVATHMMLQAYDLGVGSTWVMYFIPEAVKTEFNFPDNIIPVAMLVMGYPSETTKPSPKHTSFRPVSEVVDGDK